MTSQGSGRGPGDVVIIGAIVAVVAGGAAFFGAVLRLRRPSAAVAAAPAVSHPVPPVAHDARPNDALRQLREANESAGAGGRWARACLAANAPVPAPK